MPKPKRNKSPTGPLTRREWETLPVGEGGLTEAEARRFHALAERAARRLKLPETAVLTRTSDRGLKAGQVVGVLTVPGRTVEILPKIDDDDDAVRKALVRMLAAALDLPIAEGDLAALDTQRNDLLELLVRLFAERLLAAVRRGLPRRYIAREEDLRRLRGKLDITRQITHLAVRPDRLACRFDSLSEDTPLNRVLKAAVARLARLARTAANVRLLAELAARFESVGDSPDPLREPVRLDRTNAAFHDLHRLALLFLKEEWQNTASGRAAGFALLFPMNDLFEKFVGRCLRRALAPAPVRLQARGRHALTDADERPLFALRPDAVIGEAEGVVVLDTKWKALRPGEEKLGVEQSDVYQMLAYARSYGASRLILLYPWTGELPPEGRAREWTVAGTDIPLDVATVNVGRPDTVVDALRELLAGPERAAAGSVRAPIPRRDPHPDPPPVRA